MRIEWLPLLAMFLFLTIVIGGTLVGLYAIFNRFTAFLDKHEK